MIGKALPSTSGRHWSYSWGEGGSKTWRLGEGQGSGGLFYSITRGLRRDQVLETCLCPGARSFWQSGPLRSFVFRLGS